MALVESGDLQGRSADELNVDARSLTKTFGATRAVTGVDFHVCAGEVLGVVGGNGAGKSTLMRLIGGLLRPDSGTLRIAGTSVGVDHSPRAAMSLGVRFVHQELSLCSNLRVLENTAVELPGLVTGFGWRRRAAAVAKRSLDTVFPGHGIDVRAKVSELSVSQRQMVEIARSASDPDLRLLILDEPTSSLGAREAGQLRSYVARRRADGVSFVFISHRLQETLDFTDRIVVLQNGSVAWSGSTSDVSEAELVRLMGGGPASAGAAAPPRTAAAPGDDRPLVDVTALTHGPLTDVSIRVGRGEIVGLGGLEGSGQRQLLHEVYAAQERRDGPVRIGGRVAFVSGDRANEGILPLWEIRRNISLASVGTLTRSGVISPADERELSQTWYDRLAVRAASVDAPIMSLSGGNQQKAVIARAMASQADVIALDDPTRGVDLATKAELYRLFRGLADDGRAILWYSTDSVEFDECDRVYVMRDGHVTQELAKQEISAESIVEASFKPAGDTPGDETGRVRSRESRLRSRERLSAFIPLIALLAVLAACYAKNPDILTRFGVELTFSAAIPLSFAAAAQLFVITAGDIDLGLGYFMGLVNVIAATWLVDEPALAAAALVPLVLAYPLVGYFIHRRQVPAIIVTLGLSFVWLGFAAYRLSSPGGSAPDWLSGALDHELPVVPEAVYIVVFPGLVAYFVLHVWRYGAVLRGFGNNPRAIDAAGWSTASARVILYALAGAFAFLAGMMVTGNTLGGDPTGSASYTLLSVAAVILGGARFSGGVVAPIGSVFAVLTLILVGTMLSLLDVPNEYLAMVQGVLLLSVVGIRTVLTRSEL